MNSGRLITIKLTQIDTSGRLRDVDMDDARRLAASMQDGEIRRQITPISVRQVGEDQYKLTAGAHRVAAAEINGWEDIKAQIDDCDDDEAKLREIDENLYRSELSPFDQANFLAERREIWERMHGALKRGGDRRSKGQIVPLIEAMKAPGFFSETAQKFGLNEKTVKRALSRRAQIAPELWKALRNTPAANKGSLLDKIRKLPVEEQVDIADTIKERGCSVDHAVNLVTKPAPADPDIAAFDALRRAWTKASEATRRDFLKSIGAKK